MPSALEILSTCIFSCAKEDYIHSNIIGSSSVLEQFFLSVLGLVSLVSIWRCVYFLKEARRKAHNTEYSSLYCLSRLPFYTDGVHPQCKRLLSKRVHSWIMTLRESDLWPFCPAHWGGPGGARGEDEDAAVWRGKGGQRLPGDTLPRDGRADRRL